MSAVTAASAEYRNDLPPGHYHFADLLRSEWTKMRSVRSTMWTLGATIILIIGTAALVCAETRAHWSSMGPESRATYDPTATSLIGLLFAQFSIGVLGALVVTAEYSTGTIRATLSAVPKRSSAYAAKIVVFGVVALVVSELSAFAAFFIGQVLLSAPATHATLSTPGALRGVVGGGLFVFALGLFAMGLAAIIRHSAGAISAFVGILLVLPLIINALPNSIVTELDKFMPDRIGVSIVTTVGGISNSFSPWTGMFLLFAYAAIALSIGGALFKSRDA